MIVKVKEPQPAEVALLRDGQTLFTYLHLAAEPELTRGAAATRARPASPTRRSRTRSGRLPLLAPMSEIAGRLATQAGAFMLEKPLGGRGVLLGGVPGVAAANVIVIGGGIVGMNAAIIAIGMQADVFVFDLSVDRLRELEVVFGGRCLDGVLLDARDRGAAAARRPRDRRGAGPRRPRAVRDPREQLGLMRRAPVIVDVSIDQGGCFETSRPTTHSDPTFEVDGVTHYCVDEHARRGAGHLDLRAHQRDAALRAGARRPRRRARRSSATPGCAWGVNVRDGEITHPAVAAALGGGVRRRRGCTRRSVSWTTQREDHCRCARLSNFIDGDFRRPPTARPKPC